MLRGAAKTEEPEVGMQWTENSKKKKLYARRNGERVVAQFIERPDEIR